MQGNLFDQRSLEEKVATSIDRIRTFAPKDKTPVYVAFSGGKDSVVLKELVRMSGVPFDCHYNVTPDPPELIQFIRQHHPDVHMHYPAQPMYQLIVMKRMLPTRLRRYCCDYLKHRGGEGRTVLTGVRLAESHQREKTVRLVRPCIRLDKTTVNPILDWDDSDVWQFIEANNLSVCSLYSDGWQRLGCVGCPLGGPLHMTKEFRRWPGYLRIYYRAVEKILPEIIARRAERGKPASFSTPKEFLLWWLRDLTKDQRHASIVSHLIDQHCIREKK